MAGAVLGSVHATTLARTALKSMEALAETGAAGAGMGSGAASATQQQVGLAVQQPQGWAVGAGESVWADAITCSQTMVRLRKKAAARFMVLIYHVSCHQAPTSAWLWRVTFWRPRCPLFRQRRAS